MTKFAFKMKQFEEAVRYLPTVACTSPHSYHTKCWWTFTDLYVPWNIIVEFVQIFYDLQGKF